MAMKYRGLCVSTFFGTLICCTFTFVIRWLKKKSRLDQINWDMKTITASDYSVELKISKSNYKKWYEE